MNIFSDINNKILPVVIIAHNEEKVIKRAVESVLEQKTPLGYTVKAFVIANGCNDRTEEIVKNIEAKCPNKVTLLSIKEKGKTKAINKAIGYFEHLCETSLSAPHIIFLDADCEFNGDFNLINFIKGFEKDPKLCALSADCVPDVFYNNRNDFVAKIYRKMHSFAKSLKINSISGMCYGIRLDILKMIDFPEIQFAEDMFLSARLNGWFYKDKNIQIIFKTPKDLKTEIERRSRQEVSTKRYHKYYSYLKNKNKQVKLYEKALGNDYRWCGAMDDHVVKVWIRLRGLKSKALVMAYLLTIFWAKIKAYRTLKQLKKNKDLDYWKVLR